MDNKYLTAALELKTLNNREFEGLGAYFNNVDYGGDVILPGAFKQTLAEYAQKDSRIKRAGLFSG